jgi:23S rRNA (adenine2503-C2)-methyltransferase
MIFSDTDTDGFPDPRNQSPRAFIERLGRSGIGLPVARTVLGQAVSLGKRSPESWVGAGSISKRLAAKFEPLPSLSLEAHTISSIDNFQKLLFRTSDGLLLETVLIPLHKPGSVSLCLSSQVGCAMGCEFCATARMEARRSLRTWEIVDQFVQAREIVEGQGRRVTGAVFMGMGEPFLNYDRVLAAAELFCFPLSRAINSKAITISTVGLIDGIDRFINEDRPFRLSISLGSAFDHKRAQLVPIAARTPVTEVIAAARRYAEKRRKRVNLAYVCVSGMNVGEEDAVELARIVGDTPIRLDLIEVTDPAGRFKPPTQDELDRFRTALSLHLRQPVVRRYSGGKEIHAACGTLAARQSGSTNF